MFAGTLNTLKKRTSQFLKGDEKRDDDNYESFNFSGEAEFSTTPTIEGQLVVRYKVQNDAADSEPAIFLLNLPSSEDCGVTGAVVRAQFPLPGSFHFRFKAPMSDGTFGGYVWVDLANDEEFAPVFRGEICMKALKLPDGNVVHMHKTLTASRKIPPFQGAYAAPQYADGGATLPAQTGLEPPCFDDELSEPPPFSGAGGLTDGGFDPDRRPAAAEAPAPAPPPPPSDLIEVDLTGGCSGGGPAAPFSPPARGPTPASAPATPPPAPVKIPDRQQLVAEREANCQARVDEANRVHAERRMSEEQMKKDKQQLNNKLVAEMDKWAKTADGNKFKDIRTLISTVHTVLWPDSNWTPVSLSELVANNTNTKKFYRKAILMCHPDRHQSASAEQQVRADRIFEALNTAFKAAGDQ